MADLQEKTKKTQSVVVSLPIDIISNILARLPVKDVSRFKITNKEWYHLISSLHFSHQHFISHSSHFQDRAFFFVGKDHCLYFSSLDISYSFNPSKINFPSFFFKKIVGSCNGLLLCTCYVNGRGQYKSLVLVNPTTLQHKLISEGSYVYHNHYYGFGYDFQADDYKIVRIVYKNVQDGMLGRYEIGVYSFKSDSWKIIDSDLTGGFFFLASGVLINNNMLHWFFKGVNGIVIRGFDVCTEQWSQVPYPVFNVGFFPVRLSVFDERLCLLTHQQQTTVFVMDVYGVTDAWVKLFDWSGSRTHSNPHYPYPLFYSKTGSEILVVMGSRLCWYNSAQKTCKKLQRHNVFHKFAQPIMCTRSLVRLPGCD